MRKILFVIDNLGSGGAQRHLINIANGLSKVYSVKILLYNNRSESFYKVNKNIEIKEIKKAKFKGFNFRVFINIWKEIKHSNFIFSFMPTGNIYCLLSRLFFNFDNKIICNEVSIKSRHEKISKRIITNILYSQADHIVCNTVHQAKNLRRFPFLRNKVSTIYNGSEEKRFVYRVKKGFREKVFIIVGRIAYPKNGLMILKALKLFYKRNDFLPQIQWAGRIDNSTFEDLKLFNDMQLFLRRNKQIKSNFHLLGEIKDIDKLFKTADGLISASTIEGLPYVICEAMLSGCPVLASEISDNKIILGDNDKRGILCDPYSEESICKGLEKLVYSDEYKIREISINARAYAEEHFTNKNFIRKYLNLIEDLK